MPLPVSETNCTLAQHICLAQVVAKFESQVAGQFDPNQVDQHTRQHSVLGKDWIDVTMNHDCCRLLNRYAEFSATLPPAEER